MLNTIKSKIILITLLMLIALSLVLSVFSFLYLKSGKNLIIHGCSHSISVFAQNINKEIIKIESNARDLALHGEMFYVIDKNRETAEKTILRIFENYPDSLGGGIWFEPYLLNKAKRLYCIYAYRNNDNKIVLDESFESEKYNYPETSWYKQIIPRLNQKNKIVWSSPYYEAIGSNTLMVTAGSGIYNNGRLVGLSTVDWEISSIVKSVSEMKPTPNSFALFADVKHDYVIVSTDPYLDNDNLIGKPLSQIPWYNNTLPDRTYIKYHNKKYIPYVKFLDNNMVYIVVIPKSELFAVLYRNVLLLFASFMLLSLIISYLLYLGLKRNIDKPIEKLVQIANKISQGNSDIEIKLEKPEEFARLAETFNKMTTDIKNITKERERIEYDLSLAKKIQASSIPSVFPPFPEIKDFDIYADMTPAASVGGDFYDFFFIDDTHFMFLVADVSGHGVPAALFMMNVKTLINYLAQAGYSPVEMIERINNKICSNNKYGYFVTMFAGIIDITNGKTTCINCGHNPPLLKSGQNEYSYMTMDSNIVLGAFPDTKFNIYETQLKPDDIMLLYTDGITEAENSEHNLYGEDRLLKVLNLSASGDITEMVDYIKKDVKEFTNEYLQNDDMTLLCFKYNGKPVKTFTYHEIASKENFQSFYAWLENNCNEINLPPDIQYKVQLVAEEIYTNIFEYAYAGISDYVTLNISYDGKIFIMEFIDNGPEFNPLDREDPDVTLPPPNRDIGGLGIYIVKNTVSSINYEYTDNKNILTLKFNI